MDQHTFDRALQEVNVVRQKLTAIRQSTDLVELSQLWTEYLVHTQRAFTRLRIACSAGPSKGWCDALINTRHNDDLLKYILHARNADEHGVAPITEKNDGAILVKPKPGVDGVEIDYVEMSAGKIVLGPKAQANTIIELVPAEVKLIAVRDRGQKYDVPQSHLGKPFPKATLIAVADAGFAFLASSMEEARAYL